MRLSTFAQIHDVQTNSDVRNQSSFPFLPFRHAVISETFVKRSVIFVLLAVLLF